MKAFFWLELLSETKIVNMNDIEKITQEDNELAAIFAASQRTAKQNYSIAK
jgi:hypothetical protein